MKKRIFLCFMFLLIAAMTFSCLATEKPSVIGTDVPHRGTKIPRQVQIQHVYMSTNEYTRRLEDESQEGFYLYAAASSRGRPVMFKADAFCGGTFITTLGWRSDGVFYINPTLPVYPNGVYTLLVTATDGVHSYYEFSGRFTIKREEVYIEPVSYAVEQGQPLVWRVYTAGLSDRAEVVYEVHDEHGAVVYSQSSREHKKVMDFAFTPEKTGAYSLTAVVHKRKDASFPVQGPVQRVTEGGIGGIYSPVLNVNTLCAGEMFHLDVSVFPEACSGQSVLVSSSNPDVLRVDDNSVITAVAPGTAVLTFQGGKAHIEHTITVVAEEEVPQITLYEDEYTSDIVGREPSRNPSQATYTSLNPDIATVREDGTVVAVSEGLTLVRALHSPIDGVFLVSVRKAKACK